MNANELYVALSRTTKKDYIHLYSNKIKNNMNFTIMIKKKMLFINHLKVVNIKIVKYM